jgi:hypothetical protein
VDNTQKKLDHFYFNIQGWFNYADVYDRALAWFKDGSHFVEVGSWKGRSSSYLATNIHNSEKKIKLDCVDTWKGSWEHNLSEQEVEEKFQKGLIDENLRYQLQNLKKENLYQQFLENIKPVRHIITPVRKTSVKAAKNYKDGSLDFIMIDGAHDEENVYQDIKAWRKKLKPKGIMAGDDFSENGVKKGLARYAQEMGDEPLLLSSNAFPSWIMPTEDEELKKYWRTPIT